MDNRTSVLLVDDVSFNVQMLAELLKDDYQILEASSGKACLELLEKNRSVDLILLDVEMPEMDGYEVCRCLQREEKTRNIPVIFVTARDNEEDEEKGLKLGAVDYIRKPFSPAIVEARVKTQITLKQQCDQLQRLAMHDQLTGLYNRHYLIDTAARKIARALRHKQGLSLIIIDIDHFKLINDQYGHCGGDAVLRDIAATLLELSRTEDIVSRVGGEEFVILLEHCDIKSAENKAELMREAIELRKPQGISVTASFGVTELSVNGEGFIKFLDRSDSALYQAKNKGRNRVEIIEVNE